MDANFSDPMSDAFTKVRNGATFNDARPKSLLKKLYAAVTASGCIPVHPLRPPCGWNW